MSKLTKDQLPRHIRQALNEVEWLNPDNEFNMIKIAKRIGRGLYRHNIHFDQAVPLIMDAVVEAGLKDKDGADTRARYGLVQGLNSLWYRDTDKFMEVFC